MKKFLGIAALVFFSAFITIGCGKSKTTADDNKQTKGRYFETEYFTMFLADGYTEMAVNGGVQAYKGNNFIEIHVRGLNQTEADIEASINILAKNYEGSAPEKVELFGQVFHHSYILAQGIPQDVYLAVKDGKKISITLSGKDHDKDEDLKVMFQSIKLKP